jgi:hypothetical protein
MDNLLLTYVASNKLVEDFDVFSYDLASSILCQAIDAYLLRLPGPTTDPDPFIELSRTWTPPEPDRLVLSDAQTKLVRSLSRRILLSSCSSEDDELPQGWSALAYPESVWVLSY